MATDWSYRNYIKWKKNYPACSGKKQSPINIDTNNISECNGLCSMSMLYTSSSCNILNNNITPIINFDQGSFIKFKGVLYELTKATIHTPSLHSVNGAYYDMEVLLYHCMNRSSCSDTGGVIVSVLLQASTDESSPLNAFFNEFVNEIPADETSIEVNVKVSPKWSAEVLYPPVKSFFWYEGSLPNPPCAENWTYVIFEEVQAISQTTLNSLQLAFKDNIRPTQALGRRTVYYNNNTKFDNEDIYIADKLDAEIKQLQDKKTAITGGKADTPATSGTPVPPSALVDTNSWYLRNKTYVKGVLITISMVLVIICGIKLTKYIIRSNLLVNLMEKAVENKKMANNNAKIAESVLTVANNQNQGEYNQGGNNQFVPPPMPIPPPSAVR